MEALLLEGLGEGLRGSHSACVPSFLLNCMNPLTPLALAEWADMAGLPDGVFNVVLGDAPAIGKGGLGYCFCARAASIMMCTRWF